MAYYVQTVGAERKHELAQCLNKAVVRHPASDGPGCNVEAPLDVLLAAD